MNKKGFCLLEMIGVIAMIVMILSGVIWSFSGLINSKKVDYAKAKAGMILTAKSIFLNMKGSQGIAEFNGKASDEEKFFLLKEYVPFSSESTLAGFTPTGFRFHLNKINEKVSIFYNSQEIRY